jgi:predicted NUDIX family phosphoesterase
MPDKMDEKVAVLPRALFGDFEFPGLDTNKERLVQFYSALHNLTFKRRGDVEEDESLLQVIPYMYFLNPDDSKVFAYCRSKQSGETRLHGMYTVGIGGHLNEGDSRLGPLATLFLGATREMQEEVTLDPPNPPKVTVIGLLLLDNAAVDRVHLGVVMQLDHVGTVEPNGDEVSDPHWVHIEDTKSLKLENWSYKVVEYLLNR